jgi:uncharacterized protein YceH (UPF0502 family)
LKRTELEKILRDHLRDVRTKFGGHLAGLEIALDNYLNRAEAALADAIAAESEETETRIEALEQRVAALETDK